MGILFSRWRKKTSLGEVLESIEKDLKALESSQKRTEQLRKKFIGSLVLYSILLYIIAALVCYFYDFPKSWKAKAIRSIPLLVFPLAVYLLKRVLHYVFVSRMSKNAGRLEELKDRKRQVLEEVMEKETYKAAKDLLDKYDPNSEIVKVEKRDSTVTSPVPAVMQSPSSSKGTELRQRKASSNAESPGGPLFRTISEPSLLESPAELNQSCSSRLMNGNLGARKSNSLVDISSPNSDVKSLASPVRASPHGSPGSRMRPPQPILPRERTAIDKVIEYLVGDGPNNRYALICSECCSHNGMALKEEFEYTAFRCCYCYHLNPARKHRPVAPKLDFDTWTTPKHASAQGMIVQHRKPTNTALVRLKDDAEKTSDNVIGKVGVQDQADKPKGEFSNKPTTLLESKQKQEEH